MRRRTQPVRGGREYPTGSRTAGRQPTDPPEHPDTGRQGFAAPELPPRPSLKYLRKQAKMRKRERGIALSQAQHELAREYGFASWPPPGLALVTWP
jgi:hypothetical protein